MGQQQLLLIVLGTIIVGVAILMGITLFRNHAINTKKESLINECADIGTLAQKYYWTAQQMGGGGKSFSGFTMPNALSTTGHGTYEFTDIQPGEITIVATGNEVVVDDDHVSVTMKILPKTFEIISTVP